MAKKDVADTVDIFFGAGRKASEAGKEYRDDPNLSSEMKDIVKEIRALEAELPALEAEAKVLEAERKAREEATGSSQKKGTVADAAPVVQSQQGRPSYPPIAEPDLSLSAPVSTARQQQRGTHPYAGRTAAQARQQTYAQPIPVGAAAEPERERMSFVLPYEQAEFLKNYKYCRALMDGDPQYTLTEALTAAIELLRKHSEYEVFERPDFVRAREKKPRR